MELAANLNGDVAPRDFFDEDVEKEKEFLDVAGILDASNGLEKLTSMKARLQFYPLFTCYKAPLFTGDSEY